ncbi:MAG: cation transporter [Thermoleophilia bacterium]|nr:cation transporter [Thermoleophilia bacterium]
MLGSSWKLLKESTNILLEQAPRGIDPNEVGTKMVSVDGVEEVHDLHVWTITSGFPALSAHVLVEPGADCHAARAELERLLRDRFGLEHTTLQVEHAPGLLEIRR